MTTEAPRIRNFYSEAGKTPSARRGKLGAGEVGRIASFALLAFTDNVLTNAVLSNFGTESNFVEQFIFGHAGGPLSFGALAVKALFVLGANAFYIVCKKSSLREVQSIGSWTQGALLAGLLLTDIHNAYALEAILGNVPPPVQIPGIPIPLP